MASDEIVWQVINQQFCSYKLKTTKAQTFCRNEYNVTGLCNRQSCPLANSQYATVRSNPETGVMYLFMKTIERSHMPSKWWERIRLSNDYSKALEQIDARLQFWPKFLIHKCKQRLTRLRQVALQTKRLTREEERLGERIVQKMAPKIRKREEGRERKAEAAARIERQIEKELLGRLKSGAYGDRPLNVEEGVWKKVLKGIERAGEGTRDRDLDEGIEEEREEEEEWENELENGEVEYVSDIEGESDEEADIADMEDWLDGNSADDDSDDNDDEEGDSEDDSSDDTSGNEDSEEEVADKEKKAAAGLKRKRPSQVPAKPSKKSGKGPRREIEYEIENEPPARQTLYA